MKDHTAPVQAMVYDLGEETVRADFLAPGILRIRRFPGTKAPVQPLARYGLFRLEAFAKVAISREDDDARLLARSEHLSVTINRKDGRIDVADADGRILLAERDPPRAAGPGFGACFELPPSRRFFGLGDQTRDRIEHRGHRSELWIRNVTGYIPIPFFSTPDGFGILVNTTRQLGVDLGHAAPDRFGFECGGGTLDYCVLYGPSLPVILGRYAEVTGKPPLPPRWALGLWFICRTQANDREVMEDCHHFRAEGIPCDAIGLEPGWMETFYDGSPAKDWSRNRFPIPGYDRTPGRFTFLRAARRMGFKPGLWLCCDYDLSWEEERQVEAGPDGREGDVEAAPGQGFEQDEHFTEARRMDTVTRPDEPWYRHLAAFVDQGVEWFKQDGAWQVLDHPDRLYANGMRDDEMHNLYPLLYSKQMYRGFAEHTDRRPLCFTPAGWAGVQRWTATWTGDTGGEEKPLAACLNLTLSGHGMTTCDMQVTTPEGIHFGFLLPWAQLNSWTYFRHPWFQGAELQALFTRYARLRYRLLPYLYSCCYAAHVSGVPWMRAMPIDHADDPETHALLRQYKFGPGLLAGAFTDRVYLPRGRWYNFWTGERTDGPGWTTPGFTGWGGPLLAAAGALLPMGRPMDHVGQAPDDELTLAVFPGVPGAFTLYEDDGESLTYLESPGRTTELRQTPTPDGLRVTVEAARGEAPGAPAERLIGVEIRGMDAPPSRVRLDGATLPERDAVVREPGWAWDGARRILFACAGIRPVDRTTAFEF